MSFTYNSFIENNLDVKSNTTILGTLGIGQNTSNEPSALLELDSINKGLLFPRMTTVQRNAISSPAAGLMVYDITKNALYCYNGNTWVIQVRNIVDDSNIIVGNNTTGDSINIGSGNVLIGRDCADAYDANESIFIGDNVAEFATDSAQSVIIGANSGNLLTTGSIKNTGIGESNYLLLTTGNSNTAIGNQSGNIITTGSNNTMIGANTSGGAELNNQTALGYNASATKSNQIMMGDSNIIECVPSATASANLGTAANPWNELHLKSFANIGTTLAVGQTTSIDPSAALEIESTAGGLLLPRMTTSQREAITTPSNGLTVHDTTIGTNYFYGNGIWTQNISHRVNDSNFIIGSSNSGQGLTTGIGNVILGKDCAPLYNSNDSIFIGNNVAGSVSGTTSGNIIMGSNSANNLINGAQDNIGVGESCFTNLTSGVGNVCIGNQAGLFVETGNNNTFLGNLTEMDTLNRTYNNSIALGNQASIFKSNQVVVGNSSITEMVPESTANANLGTNTNPWNNTRLKGNASIGSSSDPVTSALLEMTSTSQGVLLPRLTTIQRNSIISPADGLMVYDTDRKSIFVYDGGTGSWFNELPRRRFNAYNNDFSTISNGIWSTLAWNVEKLKDSNSFTHSTVTNPENIIFTFSDTYLVTYTVVFTTSGNNKSYQCRCEKDSGSGFVPIIASNVFGISSGNDATSVTITYFENFNAGDILRVTGQAISNSTTLTAKINASNITIMKV